MKAWRVTDKDCSCGTVVVFAETRGKAAAWAFNYDDTFDGLDFTDLYVRRFKDYDKFYSGKRIVDFWNDLEDRIRLVRDFGWTCQEADFYCEECQASKWCEKYKEVYDDECKRIQEDDEQQVEVPQQEIQERVRIMGQSSGVRVFPDTEGQ